MSRRTTLWKVSISCLGVLSIWVLLSLSAMKFWVGVWPEGEYRFTFKDPFGSPVEGVQLRVENESGIQFYHFPVTDYLPGHTPSSDGDGVLVFHHAPSTTITGRSWWLFSMIPMGDHSGPSYVCRFLLDGREVHRVRYKDVANKGRKTVKRRWQWLTSQEIKETLYRGLEPDESASTTLRDFDLNGDGKIDREEGYAAHATFMAYYVARQRESDGEPGWEELEFRLVEREVVLDSFP